MYEAVERFNRLMKQAHKTNESRDRDDRAIGAATPNDGPLDLRLRTPMEAIRAGIMVEDWPAVAEGLVMLQVLHRDIRRGTCEPAELDD